MTHYAFRKGAKLVLETDWVVVGSGAGGATAALELARAGEHVTLVEAGAWRDPKDYPYSVYGTMRDWFYEWGSTVSVGRAISPVVQAIGVGGSTTINSAICVRTPEDVFDDWQREHGLDKARFSRELWRHQADLERELNAVEVPIQIRGRNNELAALGAEGSGFVGHAMTRYVRDCEGASDCVQGCKKGKKQSLNLTFVPELVERGGVVVSCAPVERVDMAYRRATGVSGRFLHPQTREKGAHFSIRARKGVFVAGSSTQSAPLLERSGVRHRALGEYFRGHPGTGVLGIFDEPVDMHSGATQGWASTAFRESKLIKIETLNMPLELLAGRLSGGGSALMEKVSRYKYLSMFVVALRAKASGSVRNGPIGRPTVRYGLEAEDLHRMREGIAIVGRMQVAAGAKALIPGVFGLPDILPADDVGKLDTMPLDPRGYTSVLSHLFGGAVMGGDPARSVCDEEGRVRGVDGLWVADASVLPSTLGVNPQHTIMAMARTIAEGALERTQTSRRS